jgi:hypothetical protein
MLAKSVVEILSQASPLTIRHLRDLAVESLPLSDLAL